MTLIDYLTERGENVVVIEADTSNPDVARMFEKNLPCYHVDLSTENGWMDLMDAVIKHAGHTFVMSTPGGAGVHLKKHLPSFVSFLKQHKTPMSMELWWAMNPQHDSVNLLGEAIDNYGEHFAKVRVILNLHFSDNNASSYFLWEESPLRTRLEKQGAVTLHLEGLHLRVVTKLFDPTRIMPFADAADAALGEKVGLSESERFKLSYWRDRQATLFGRAFPPVTTTAPLAATV
jgi:hypothetical protein